MHARLASAAVLIGASLGIGCSEGFDPTYELTCPGTFSVGAPQDVVLDYTAFDPVVIAWRSDDPAGRFEPAEQGAAPTNEGEPAELPAAFTPGTEGAARLTAVVDGDEVAGCDVTVLPAGTEPVSLTLTVVGGGEVTGAPGDLSCPGACSASYAPGTMVVLTATPDAGWTLGAVTGDCAEGPAGGYSVVLQQQDAACSFTFEEEGATNTVAIEPGTFERGCPDPATCPGDAPLTTVTLSEGFAIDIREVTVADYRACVDAGACSEPVAYDPGEQSPRLTCNWGAPDIDQHPINCVTWAQAAAYCQFRGQALPTEAQWERAARGAEDTRAYPWGDADPSCDLANVVLVPFVRCADGTAPAGAHPEGASPAGALDMTGNLAEWVQDWYDAGYYDEVSSTVNPTGPASGLTRVVRGGSYRSVENLATVHYRGGNTEPAQALPDVGFRCVTPGGQ